MRTLIVLITWIKRYDAELIYSTLVGIVVGLITWSVLSSNKNEKCLETEDTIVTGVGVDGNGNAVTTTAVASKCVVRAVKTNGKWHIEERGQWSSSE